MIVLKFFQYVIFLFLYFSDEEALQVEWQFISNVKDLLEKEKEEIKEELEKESYTPIEIMGLSPRTLNAFNKMKYSIYWTIGKMYRN